MPQRVAYLTAASERGGAEVVLSTVLAHLDRARWTPIVLAIGGGTYARDLARDAGVEMEALPAGRFRNVVHGVATVRRLRRALDCHRAVLLHCNGTAAQFYGSFAARACRVPAIYHLHDNPDASWTMSGFVNRVAARGETATVVAVSEYLAQRFRDVRASGVPVRVIPNGVHVDEARRERVAAEGAALRAGLGWSSTQPVVAWCGRLQRWKGAHIFLRAAAIVRAAVPDARFLLVGGTMFGLEAGYAAELRALSRQLGLDEVVHFAGHQPDALPYIASADLFVHSAIQAEPFGLVIVEAMALGKPVIAANAGGPIEIVDEGVTGMRTPPANAEALGAAMMALLGDRQARARLGAAGRARVAERFSAEAMVRQIEGLYGDVLTGRRRAA